MTKSTIVVTIEQMTRWRDRLSHLNILSGHQIKGVATDVVNEVQNEIRTVLEQGDQNVLACVKLKCGEPRVPLSQYCEKHVREA